MSNEELVRQIMAEVVKSLGRNDASFAKAPASGGVTSAQYPLAEKIPEKLKSASGKAYAEFSLEKVISGELTADDFRTAPATLIMQAEVAESVGRDAFARNLRRAAELTAVPDDELLGIYNALRPYRSTKAELLAIADTLENKYGCTISAGFVREAAGVYEQRGRLRVD
jgi:propanediol dehydratase small subunit